MPQYFYALMPCTKKLFKDRHVVMHSTQFTFRPATESDVAHLIHFLSSDPIGQAPNDPSSHVPNMYRCPAAQIFVATHQEEIVGTLTAAWDGRNGTIRYFLIAPHLRRTRWMAYISDALFRLAIHYLHGVGMQQIRLFVTTHRDSETLKRMYIRKLRAKIVHVEVLELSLPALLLNPPTLGPE